MGEDDVQGAVIPLTVDGRLAAVLLVGFAAAAGDESVEQRLGRLRRAWSIARPAPE